MVCDILFSAFCFEIRQCNSDIKIVQMLFQQISFHQTFILKCFNYFEIFLNVKCFHMKCIIILLPISKEYAFW